MTFKVGDLLCASLNSKIYRQIASKGNDPHDGDFYELVEVAGSENVGDTLRYSVDRCDFFHFLAYGIEDKFSNEHKKCSCELTLVMNRGCKCGGI